MVSIPGSGIERHRIANNVVCLRSSAVDEVGASPVRPFAKVRKSRNIPIARTLMRLPVTGECPTFVAHEPQPLCTPSFFVLIASPIASNLFFTHASKFPDRDVFSL